VETRPKESLSVLPEGGVGSEQTMYTYVSKCKHDKIKKEKEKKNL
jgi:hypothetical protein